ncbi:MAG: hypothetical protein HGA87_06915, partial [Desulfobulbaceae bacterium]|nr:hypothetical protein [Desulfobulbaceae bacterium]
MNSRSNDILLVFPPHWAFTMPHLALPCLHGALAAAGHGTTLMDINLEFHRWLFSSEGIGALGSRISSRIEYLEAKSTISSSEATFFRKLIAGDAVAHRLQTEIDSAVDVLTTEKFYNPHLLTNANKNLASAYGLVGTAFYPSRMDFISFQTKVNPATREGLAEITQDDVTNPYRYFFAHYTIPSIRDLNPRLIG